MEDKLCLRFEVNAYIRFGCDWKTTSFSALGLEVNGRHLVLCLRFEGELKTTSFSAKCLDVNRRRPFSLLKVGR